MNETILTKRLESSLLYHTITRYGKFFTLKCRSEPTQFLKDIKIFDNDWKQYNPRKNILREGLSITSLDGHLSGIPDLDSFLEYNKENGTRFSDVDITTPTPVYQHALRFAEPFKDYICRAHVIRLGPGGFFPTHRDSYSLGMKAFRLFVPLHGCNPPNFYFMQENRILNFDHGQTYFIDTCIEHSLFNMNDSFAYFIVFNIKLTQESTEILLSSMS